MITINKIIKKIAKNLTQKRTKEIHVIHFLEQLYYLILADIPLLNALEMLKLQLKDNLLSNTIADFITKIRQGESLASAMATSPKHFPLIITEQIKLADETGMLAEQLKHISESLKQAHEIKSNIVKAITYPALVLGLSIIISIILLIFVIPIFQDVFSQFNAKLPAFTQVLIKISHNLTRDIKYYLLAVLLFILTFKISYRKSAKFRYGIDFMLINTPVIKKINQDYICAQFAQTIRTTTQANIPIDKALLLTANIIKNSFVAIKIKKSISKIKSGENLSYALLNNFSSFLIQMIEIGEETGNLSDMLQKASNYHQKNLTSSTQKLQQLLEPALILVIGCIIGSFTIGMYLPIFNIGNIV